MFPTRFIQQPMLGLWHLLFPKLCAGCSEPLHQDQELLCFSCEQSLAAKIILPEQENETSLRLSGRFPFYTAFSLCTFSEGSLIQHLLHQLKYKNKPEIGIELGKMLGHALADKNWCQQIDGIIPVPLHRKKEQQRGYNQSLHIAQGMAAVVGVDVWDNNLVRSKPTESQTTKSRLERLENVGDAFSVKDAKAFSGKHLLLVDDVLTTGATLEACARVLQMEDGTKVSIATVAVA